MIYRTHLILPEFTMFINSGNFSIGRIVVKRNASGVAQRRLA
jgi:hypothetical protein